MKHIKADTIDCLKSSEFLCSLIKVAYCRVSFHQYIWDFVVINSRDSIYFSDGTVQICSRITFERVFLSSRKINFEIYMETHSRVVFFGIQLLLLLLLLLYESSLMFEIYGNKISLSMMVWAQNLAKFGSDIRSLLTFQFFHTII